MVLQGYNIDSMLKVGVNRYMSKKYKKSELKLGMQVKLSEIDHILDTHIILLDTKLIDNNDLIGELVYIGDGKDKESDKWFKQSRPITPLYFSSESLRDDISYDG